jgi:hypothetical protein
MPRTARRLEALRDNKRPLRELLTWRVAASAGLMPTRRHGAHQERSSGGRPDLRGFATRWGRLSRFW